MWEGRKTVELADVNKLIAEKAKMPEEHISGNATQKLRNLEDSIKSQIYDQDEAVEYVVDAMISAQSNFNKGTKPYGSFLFLGPTGNGKSETAKVLAREMGLPLVQFDMSEYMEKHTISRLIGSPPGYVGYDETAQLTDAVKRNPYGIYMFDEVEKAHPDVLNILLQVMEEGHCKDAQGNLIDMRHATIIMTSNLGAAKDENKAFMGFATSEEQAVSPSVNMEKVTQFFKPEFLNRLDAVIGFNKLAPETMPKLVDKMLKELNEKQAPANISIEFDEAGKGYLAKEGYSEDFGARPLKRLINQAITKRIERMSVLDGWGDNQVKVKVSFNENAKPSEEAEPSLEDHKAAFNIDADVGDRIPKSDEPLTQKLRLN